MKTNTLEYYQTKHRCTCEGGPEHPCLYPKECFDWHNSECYKVGHCSDMNKETRLCNRIDTGNCPEAN